MTLNSVDVLGRIILRPLHVLQLDRIGDIAGISALPASSNCKRRDNSDHQWKRPQHEIQSFALELGSNDRARNALRYWMKPSGQLRTTCPALRERSISTHSGHKGNVRFRPIPAH